MKLEPLEGDGGINQPEEDERARGGDSWGKSALGTGNSRCKGPEAGSHLEQVEECLTGGER